MRRALGHLAAQGITSFQDAGSEAGEIATFQQFANNNELSARLYLMLAGWDQQLLNQWMTRGIERDPKHWLTIGGVKLVADGALGSRGAWLLEDYEDRRNHRGNPVMPMSMIEQRARAAVDNGFQVAVHAIGDRANREVLDLFQQFSTKIGGDLRPRVEHAQHLHPDDIERFGEFNVIASMQGIHMSSDRPWAIDRLGIQRIESGAYMWRALLDSGAVIANGTDAPVEPINPIASFYSLVTRQTLFRATIIPAAAISSGISLSEPVSRSASSAGNQRVSGSRMA